MSENENNRQVSLENIREVELSIIFVRKKMFKIIDNFNTTPNTHLKQRKKLYKYNKFKIFRCKKQQIKPYTIRTNKDACIHNKASYRNYKKMNSMPILNNQQNEHSTSSTAKSWNNFLSSNPRNFNSNLIVNTLITSQYQNSECPYLNNYSFLRPCWKVYRCQLSTKEETCCCSCNSDAMFEVMKSLYDCYKKKNCDNCNCILCGHLPREERRLGELRKKGELSFGAISEFTEQAYIKKLPPEKVEKLKAQGLLTPLEGKSLDKKEEILRGLAMNGIPLPKGKTASDIKLIDKIRRDIGLPPEPKSSSAKKKYEKAVASGLITPLFGKSRSEKERILKGQADLGLALPVGRTKSEKNLIAKLKGSKAPSLKLLRDKMPAEKEKYIKDLAMKGMQLPEGKTSSEKELIEKVRTEVGLPPASKTPLDRKKYEKASGLIKPLVEKTASEREKKLREQAKIPLPEGRTPSEKPLISKVKEEYTPDRIKRAKAGQITPLLGKTPEQKENILRELVMHKIPLPEGKTASEKQIISKVRKDLGMPPEPRAKHEKDKYNEAIVAGLITPLEGKTQSQKEKILQTQAAMGFQLPEGRTASEKSLIKRIKKKSLPPEKRKKLDEKTLKVLKEGKGPSDECICGVIESELVYATPLQKEKKIRELAMQGFPLPEAKTASEKKLYEKVQADLGLPPVPTTPSLKEKYSRAQNAGIIMPLEGKTKSQKAKILVKQAEIGIPLPEGRTPSEKALVNKVRATVKPITGKTPEEQRKILRNIVKAGLPLPEGTTPSEKQIIKHVKNDIGIPSTGIPSEQFLKAKAAGLITPLEGKTKAQKEKILRDRIATGLPLPEGVTPSDKELIKKVKESTGYKTPKYPSKIIKKKSVGLLEGKTTSEKSIIDKMKEVKVTPEKKSLSAKLKRAKAAGLLTPPEGKKEPKTLSLKEKIKQAQTDGIVTPLEGKTPAEKEKILIKMHDAGKPLPKGRTASEKSLVKKIKARPRRVKEASSEKLRKAKGAGFLTPLEGKTTDQKEHILRGLAKTGVPLPEGKTSSEKKIIEKVREEVGLPPEPKTPSLREKMKQAQIDGIIIPLEGKTPAEKEKILLKMHEAGIPLPKGRTASEKSLIKKVKAGVITRPYIVPSKKLREAKAMGLLTPLEGKTSAQKEKIITGLAKAGLPLPEGKTASEKALINKVQEKIKKIDKKSAKILKEAKGPSDECICDMLKPMTTPKKANSMTALIGKTPEEKEKYLKDIALQGIPLPEAKTKSDKILINKIRANLALPPEPTTASLKEKYYKALDAGLITPLQGKSEGQKEKILRGQAAMGLLLPEGRTPSERDLIAKVRATTPPVQKIKSEKLRKAKAAGILTPLEGKSPEQKEKILKGLATHGIPLPEPKTSSERNIIDKVRAEVGLPPAPKTKQEKEMYDRAIAAGLITPLQGKSQSQKEKILRGQAELGLHLPEGRTPSEKEFIAKVRATTPSVPKIKSEKLRKAKTAGLLTPLHGKSPEQKEKILKGLAMHGIPLPEPTTSSERKIIDRVRAEVGLPPEPKTRQERQKYDRAIAAGLITPLQGKSPSVKEKILQGQAEIGLSLPEGRTRSEKDLIAKVRATKPPLSKVHIPLKSEKLRKAKAAGILTPLQGKSAEQKEKILKGLAMHGIPLPEPKTSSERNIIDKVRAEVGLPPAPKTKQEKEMYDRAIAAGLITPLQGKSQSQKEKILRGQAELGLHLPEGRTPSEKEFIAKVRATTPSVIKVKSEKLRKAKAAGLLTPLEGKSPEQKEKYLKGLAMRGIPLPEPKTSSERNIMNKVRAEVGLPPEPKTRHEKEKYNRAVAAGIITPLQGKSPSQKEKILRGQAKLGLPLPEGRTPSEKSLIRKVKETTPVEPESQMMPSEELAKLDKKTAKNMKEGKGPSDECICHILSPRRPSLSKKSTKIFKIPSEKLRKAKEAGLVTPLKGKSTAQKEKIIKGLALQGIPLPEPKTDSERKLIDKVRTDLGLPPEPKNKSAKKVYNKALADGFITPLQGKSHAQKEKILRKQAELGLLLPEGRTPSEKSLIAKIEKTGPPPLETPSLREKVSKARAAGLLTPLEGKTFEQKEKNLKTLAEAGLPLPKGKTPSERSLIRKVETEYGKLAKAKTKSKKVGEAVARKKGGITEKFEDIIKTTTCDRGCGCDKKKIKFKHSYVKIRVTSPDISSLCPCPEECVPGVKGGVFTDNEGIKVTVGRVTGVPSFSSRKSFDGDHTYFESSNITLLKKIYIGDENSVHTYHQPKSYKDTNITCSKSETEINVQKRYTKQCYRRNYKTCSSYNSIDILRNDCKVNSTSAEIIQSLEKNLNSSKECFITNTSNNTSFESMFLLKKYSSVSLLSLPTSISIISFSTTELSSNSSFYKDKISYISLNLSECLQSANSFSTSDARDNSFECNDCFSNTCYLMKTNYLSKKESAIIHKSNSLNIHDFICDILSKRPINNTSSLVIVMSTTSDEHTSKYSLDDRGQLSTIAIDLLENHNNWNYKANSLHHFHEKHRGFKIMNKGKICEKNNTSTMLAESNRRNMQNKKEIYERNLLINECDDQNHLTFTRNQNHFRIISTDTTQDRPCCCKPKEGFSHEKHKYSQDNNRIRQPRLTSTHSNLGMPTPIRFCKIPPCNDLTKNVNPSIPNCVSKKTPSNNATSDTIFKTCDCSPDKLMKLFEKSKKEMLSKTCNNRSAEMIVQKYQLPNEHRALECNKCRSNKLPEAGNWKKVKKLCPCEQQKNFIKNDIADKINDQNGTSSKNCCKCKEQKHFTKNIICECPEPEPEIDFIDWIDEKQERKLKSDLTQTISGFKIEIPRKKTDWENWELEMSFEETLRYIAENLENESKQYNSDICSCKNDLKLQSENVSTACECPQDAYPPESQEEETFEKEPFTGIKFHISGKGSGSKGLNGILCFQSLKSFSKPIPIKENTDL